MPCTHTSLVRNNVSLAPPVVDDFQIPAWKDVEYRCYRSTPYAVIMGDPEEKFKRVMQDWHRENYFSVVKKTRASKSYASCSSKIS